MDQPSSKQPKEPTSEDRQQKKEEVSELDFNNISSIAHLQQPWWKQYFYLFIYLFILSDKMSIKYQNIHDLSAFFAAPWLNFFNYSYSALYYYVIFVGTFIFIVIIWFPFVVEFAR